MIAANRAALRNSSWARRAVFDANPNASPADSSTGAVASDHRSVSNRSRTRALTNDITTPEAIPPLGPNRIAAEMTALVAHRVVGRVWRVLYQS
ncbi:unannotated protein [freshwater metagenome]|uniref:Unannotated protein n=1 Tax=freshwater metagenome TaxID=449393 RepID=A0A6J7FM41_9ZZZZ